MGVGYSGGRLHHEKQPYLPKYEKPIVWVPKQIKIANALIIPYQAIPF